MDLMKNSEIVSARFDNIKTF